MPTQVGIHASRGGTSPPCWRGSPPPRGWRYRALVRRPQHLL